MQSKPTWLSTFWCLTTSAFFSPLAKTGFEMKTDTELKNEVAEELIWEPTITSTNITVEAKGGVVTLSGTVPYYAEKGAAERATKRVEGVKAIAEELEVSFTGVHSRTDSDIAEALVSSLKWHVWVPSSVQATVENGWVTLTGAVKWGYERTSAESAVTHLAGVKGVSNNITLKPSVKPTAVKEAIEKALKRNAEIDAENVIVSAEGSKITLSGSIRSWDEREQAGAAAWNAPGVTAVANDLTLSLL